LTRLFNDLTGFFFGLPQMFGSAFLGERQVSCSTFRSCEAVRNGLLPFTHGRNQRRPDEPLAEPDEE